MSDSGKQNCKHGRTKAYCCDCKDAEIFATRLHVQRLHTFIEKIIAHGMTAAAAREGRELLKDAP